MATPPPVLVIGADVIGLSAAVTLAEAGYRSSPRDLATSAVLSLSTQVPPAQRPDGLGGSPASRQDRQLGQLAR